MKDHPRAHVILTLLLTPLLSLQGCSISNSAVPFGSGDHVSNSQGHGTGEVYGVKLEVIDAGGTKVTAKQMSSEGMPIDGGAPVKGGTISEIELGTVELTFVNSPSGKITMSMDGYGYGQVKAGDSVVVDEQRVVTVNGAHRAPQQN